MKNYLTPAEFENEVTVNFVRPNHNKDWSDNTEGMLAANPNAAYFYASFGLGYFKFPRNEARCYADKFPYSPITGNIFWKATSQ